ncbi:MAG: hypothetical protein HOV80_22080 [Polyangiaceae bacterium]|nr:hypothetical protein [Polyangiaceae bacterium]
MAPIRWLRRQLVNLGQRLSAAAAPGADPSLVALRFALSFVRTTEQEGKKS